MARWGLLLVNLGTPDSPATGDVRRYLREFLSDPRVIDISAPARFVLVNGIIAPFRSPKSAEAYRKVWTEDGSPLLVHGKALAAAAQDALGDEWHVELGMRYGNPDLPGAFERCRRAAPERMVVLPLYPHYASSSTGSTLERLFEIAGAETAVPALRVVPSFYDHPFFVEAVTAVSRGPMDDFGADHVMFSFHGLPERQVLACDETGGRHCLAKPDCCDRMVDANVNCYRAQCYATARALAASLELPDGGWEVAFQSRLGRTPWIRPYTDERVKELAAGGVRRLAVLTPSFVADCLETLEEIAIRAREDFQAAGGDELALIPCVNSDPAWIRAVVRLAREAVGLENEQPGSTRAR